jgi:hypothetical protein
MWAPAQHREDRIATGIDTWLVDSGLLWSIQEMSIGAALAPPIPPRDVPLLRRPARDTIVS